MDALITDTQDVRRYMRSRAPDSSLVHPVRALLGRYLAIRDACEWPLSAPGDVDVNAFAAHLGAVLAVPVNDVRAVSLSAPYADMGWATGEGVARLLDEGLSAGLDASLDDEFGGNYWIRLQLAMERRMLAGLGEARLEILERDVARKFMPGLRQALFATLAGPVNVRRVEQCANAVEDTLLALVAMTVLDDRVWGVPLGHVVRMMTGAIPLGEKRDEPGVWICLAA